MRTFKIELMNKTEIKIEAEEIPKVLRAIASASPAILKQGIFNPSAYSDIVEDKEREKIKEVNEFGHYTGVSTIKPLDDIFKDIPEIQEMRLGSKSIADKMQIT